MAASVRFWFLIPSWWPFPSSATGATYPRLDPAPLDLSPGIAPAGAAPGTESRPGTTQEPKAALALQPHCFPSPRAAPVDTGVRVSAPASCERSCTSSSHSLGRGRGFLGGVL